MDSIGILPQFRGILCHDHLKSYYTYSCTHALCNAHHLRELEGVWEEDNKQRWAKEMKTLLEEINCATNDAGGEYWEPVSLKNTGKGTGRYCKTQKPKALPLMKQTVRGKFEPGINNAISRRIAGFSSLIEIVSENTLNSYAP